MAIRAGRVGVLPSEVTPEGKIRGGGGTPSSIPLATDTTIGGIKVANDSGLYIDTDGFLRLKKDASLLTIDFTTFSSSDYPDIVLSDCTVDTGGLHFDTNTSWIRLGKYVDSRKDLFVELDVGSSTITANNTMRVLMFGDSASSNSEGFFAYSNSDAYWSSYADRTWKGAFNISTSRQAILDSKIAIFYKNKQVIVYQNGLEIGRYEIAKDIYLNYLFMGSTEYSPKGLTVKKMVIKDVNPYAQEV